MQSCTTTTTVCFQDALWAPIATLYSLAVTPYFHASQLQAPTNLLPVSVDLPVLDISSTWNHTLGGLLYLLPLNIMFPGCIRVVTHVCTSVFSGEMISRCMDRPYCYESCHQLMDTWIVSTFRLEWIIPLWTFMYKFPPGCRFSSPLGVE